MRRDATGMPGICAAGPRRLFVLALLLVFGLGTAGAVGAQPPQMQQHSQAGKDEGAKLLQPKPAQWDVRKELVDEVTSVTHHSMTLAGQKIDYTATAGTMILRDEAGKPTGSIFYVAYTRDGVGDMGQRPVTFSYNGGPGSAAVWVHLGAFGPKRAALDPEGMPSGPPPGHLVDNEDSVLDATDLVFIDPISTGYSRPAPGENADQFHGFENDVQSVGEFIRLWLTKNERWASPKFLAGESYGTTRSAGLAGYLQDRYGMYINGIALISSVLDFQTLIFTEGNDLPYVLYLPTYTASAWYHHKLPERLSGDLDATLAEVEQFARGEYATALLMGDDLPDAERATIVDKLAEYTGLSKDFIEQSNLRIRADRFFKELLRDQHKTIGRLDSRFTGWDRDAAGERPEYDPSGVAVDAYFVSLLNDYLRTDLGFKSDLPFDYSAMVWPWDFRWRGQRGWVPGYLNVAEILRRAMTENPKLQVLIMSGHFDLATPFFGSDYTIDHMSLPPELRDNIRATYYEAGHMFYIRAADHAKMRRDFLDLIQRALAQ